VKIKKPKRNIWVDPPTYGTYEGERGNPEQWSQFCNTAWEKFGFSKQEASIILDYDSPYVILGIEKTATQEQIKTAWRKLVLIHHPDKGGDRKQFEKVMAAFSTLKED
jgi:DnaJ-class molecular chaperone